MGILVNLARALERNEQKEIQRNIELIQAAEKQLAADKKDIVSVDRCEIYDKLLSITEGLIDTSVLIDAHITAGEEMQAALLVGHSNKVVLEFLKWLTRLLDTAEKAAE